MSVGSSDYADWKAPDEDGQILIWPDAATIMRQTGENHRLLSNCSAPIQNVPLSELRRRQRHWIGHGEDDQPLIASGHQTELFHPGVWAKDVMSNAVARKLGGRAWHFSVDTDSPKHLHLRWPGGSVPMTDDPRLNSAAWIGLLRAPSAAHLFEVESTFREAELGWDFSPMVGKFLEALKRASAEEQSLVGALTSAIHELDWTLGLRHDELLVSLMCGCEPWLVFAHHLLARAEQLAGHYNGALSEYRVEQRIASPGRPMPDLLTGGDRVETPFWLDDLAKDSRERLFVTRAGVGVWRLRDFEFDPAAEGFEAAAKLHERLNEHRLRIWPRALTLTTFFRLLLADQFVHGIGGARYDRVADRLIARFFGIEPPRFCVTTATLYFPAARGERRVNLRPLLQEGRRLRHGSFSKEKRELASRIATLPRHSPARRELFNEMHTKLAQHLGSNGMREWSARMERATQEQMRQKTLFDRELFFAIQPEERLQEVLSRYDAALM
jgi:hypothetical protein